jgi:hypothetical protein
MIKKYEHFLLEYTLSRIALSPPRSRGIFKKSGTLIPELSMRIRQCWQTYFPPTAGWLWVERVTGCVLAAQGMTLSRWEGCTKGGEEAFHQPAPPSHPPNTLRRKPTLPRTALRTASAVVTPPLQNCSPHSPCTSPSISTPSPLGSRALPTTAEARVPIVHAYLPFSVPHVCVLLSFGTDLDVRQSKNEEEISLVDATASPKHPPPADPLPTASLMTSSLSLPLSSHPTLDIPVHRCLHSLLPLPTTYVSVIVNTCALTCVEYTFMRDTRVSRSYIHTCYELTLLNPSSILLYFLHT